VKMTDSDGRAVWGGVAARGTAGGMENGAKEGAPGRRSSSPTHARHPLKTPRIRSPEAEAGGVGQHHWAAHGPGWRHWRRHAGLPGSSIQESTDAVPMSG
jgi:hypothetical protein